ncbi:FhuF 2Fe-2S C-terminal domain-containing protein [Geodermatophilus telluris]|uniref:FhuF 2Fe-2S C-terminal domain-containing protein n=1 Tax=Geodermatophilus telluris TaxID=1190417 RepID=A0A1G6LH73_9ACTN|nr:(2Fe-2S)-binding protein [Geodermatophilus telluris]SDC41916.1 FhuF 2Fe-2S C-terminal domain-containing protein [Geodermatophilus telluris]
MDGGPQAQVAARVPGAAGLGLLAPPSARPLPAELLADPAWTARRVAALGRRYRSADRRVLATVWWYSASAVLLAPLAAGLATGRPLSARLADTTLYELAGGPLVAAVSAAPAGPDPAGELRAALAAAVAAVAEAGGVRERPLWAVAADSLAGRLLAVGRALDAVGPMTALAAPVAAAVGSPLPAPRFTDVGGTRFVRRVSCCLLYRLPPEPMCTACPGRPPEHRRVLLEAAAGQW